jgi:hypothetical protein
MTQLSIDYPTVSAKHPLTAANGLVMGALTIIAVSALLAGFVPLGFSIVTVFLFAGPHNWLECRYFLSRMPAHWGPLRVFFITAIVGILTLTGAYIAMPILARHYAWTGRDWSTASSAWDSAVILWIAALVVLRSRQEPRRDWNIAIPIALLLVAGAWLVPAAWDLGLVYLHPLVALWFLDRELGRTRSTWQRSYRLSLLAVPAALGILWLRLAHAPNLAGTDMLTMRITRHAGANILSGVSSHALVATHTFLEMLHYGVWVAAIPLVAMRRAPWDVQSAPLARRGCVWKRSVVAFAGVGVVVVLVLWTGFVTNYPLTRDIYFTVAIAHVLAEAPFLLRVL